MKFVCYFTIFVCWSIPAFATEDFYHFDSVSTQTRFQELTSNLRCLVCQNQNIAESNAPLANDLRSQVYQQIQHGKSDADIIQWLVARYGDFILYQPPMRGATLLLWIGPLVFLLSGVSYLFFYLRQHRVSSPT